jgi:hypothetical protein
MSDPQQLDREIREYLEKEPNLRREDRLLYLKAMMNKHFEFTKLEHVVNSNDLFDIMSGAKNNFSKRKLPVRISRKQVESGEAANVSVIESFISYLNKANLLKKTVKFDYTD